MRNLNPAVGWFIQGYLIHFLCMTNRASKMYVIVAEGRKNKRIVEDEKGELVVNLGVAGCNYTQVQGFYPPQIHVNLGVAGCN